MKLIIWKELRENLKWALLGMAVFSIALLYAYSKISEIDYYPSYEGRESICAPIFLMATTIGSAVLGMAMGLLQTLTELRSRDQWAFLIHRPVHRNTIYQGKIIAGIILYLMATTIPFTIMCWWVSLPGKLAVPFDWGLSLAGDADILTGICYYFAGILVGLRQARWWGSRTMVLATALYVSFLENSSLEFWQAAAWIFSISLILGTAAEGSFRTTRTFRLQNKIAKAALGIALWLGFLEIITLLIPFAGNLTREQGFGPWSQYGIMKDGTVVIEKSKSLENPSISTLDGKPMNLSKEKLSRFYQETLRMGPLRDSYGYYFPNSYRSSNRFFLRLQFWGDNKRWFYVFKKGIFLAYDIMSQKPSEIIGSNGFSTEGKVKPFEGTLIREPWGDDKVFRFPRSAYWIDLLQEEVIPLNSAAQSPEIIGSCEVGRSNSGLDEENVHAAAMATAKGVQFFDPKGQLIFETPWHYKPPYEQVEAALTPKGDRYFLWYHAEMDEEGNEDRSEWPSYLVELSNTGQVIQQLTLPALPQPGGKTPWTYYLSVWATPMGTTLWNDGKTLVLYEWGDKNAKRSLKEIKKDWKRCLKNVLSQAGVGLLCVIPVFFRSRKYLLEVGHPRTWLAIVFLAGIPGLLTFLCIREWPAKEACAICGKKRLVTRDLCEHCNAPFPPPSPDGTEIFEAHLAPNIRG